MTIVLFGVWTRTISLPIPYANTKFVRSFISFTLVISECFFVLKKNYTVTHLKERAETIGLLMLPVW